MPKAPMPGSLSLAPALILSGFAAVPDWKFDRKPRIQQVYFVQYFGGICNALWSPGNYRQIRERAAHMFVQTKNHCTAIRFPVLRESRCRPVARFAARAIAPFWTGIFLMFVSLTVQGQECAATSELPTQERISCLDMQINSLETQLKVSGNAGDIDQEKITSEFEEGIHAGWYGPVHTVQKIDIDGPIATDMYWRNNTYLGKTNLCYPTTVGIRRAGAWDKGLKDSAPKGMALYVVRRESVLEDGCRSIDRCIAVSGEKCVTHYLREGCYVSKEWLKWYQKEIERINMPENKNLICVD